MNYTHNKSRRRSRRLFSRRAGFTLVEMLVAVALVLLLMSMFAQVFQIAGNTMSKQRGIAENDQRSRTLQNVIKGDLDKRTFRLVVPWVNQENGQLPEAEGPQRQGYLYISENDPASETDDFLQLTVSANVITKQKDFEPFTGKATLIGYQTVNSMASGYLDPTDPDFQQLKNRRLYNQPNQPEADDGRTTLEDGTATSSAAEVAYFLRNGNLYRRVLLIREPLPSVGAADSQPRFKLNNNNLWNAFDYTSDPQPNLATYWETRNFWNDFDFSAVPVQFDSDPRYYAKFHGVDDLNNASTNTQFPLGRPSWRFGHHTRWGRSRELDRADANPNFFVGRLTHEETSHSNLTYPHGYAGAIADPMAIAYADSNGNGVIDGLEGGPRRAEDLLMPNVHSFDIKVWDDLANRFVDIGGPDAIYYSQAYRSSSGGETYGPSQNNTFNNVFDTWHPDVDLDLDLSGGTLDMDEENLQPPFRLRLHRPSSGNDHPSINDMTPTTFPMPVNGNTSRFLDPWAPNETGLTVNSQPRFPRASELQASTRFYYRIVGVFGSTPQTGANPPNWPTAAGQRVVDADASGMNGVIWEAVDNWRPLKAIQITVRFFDIPSDQMRQMTIVHSLVD